MFLADDLVDDKVNETKLFDNYAEHRVAVDLVYKTNVTECVIYAAYYYTQDKQYYSLELASVAGINNTHYYSTFNSKGL